MTDTGNTMASFIRGERGINAIPRDIGITTAYISIAIIILSAE